MSDIDQQVSRRRTFAIISHPDAGKTTLTEKLLLFGGAIKLAGTVKGRKASRHARSDWMVLEQTALLIYWILRVTKISPKTLIER